MPVRMRIMFDAEIPRRRLERVLSAAQRIPGARVEVERKPKKAPPAKPRKSSKKAPPAKPPRKTMRQEAQEMRAKARGRRRA